MRTYLLAILLVALSLSLTSLAGADCTPITALPEEIIPVEGTYTPTGTYPATATITPSYEWGFFECNSDGSDCSAAYDLYDDEGKLIDFTSYTSALLTFKAPTAVGCYVLMLTVDINAQYTTPNGDVVSLAYPCTSVDCWKICIEGTCELCDHVRCVSWADIPDTCPYEICFDGVLDADQTMTFYLDDASIGSVTGIFDARPGLGDDQPYCVEIDWDGSTSGTPIAVGEHHLEMEITEGSEQVYYCDSYVLVVEDPVADIEEGSDS